MHELYKMRYINASYYYYYYQWIETLSFQGVLLCKWHEWKDVALLKYVMFRFNRRHPLLKIL